MNEKGLSSPCQVKKPLEKRTHLLLLRLLRLPLFHSCYGGSYEEVMVVTVVSPASLASRNKFLRF